jgi:hypothetical protein
MSQRDRTRLIGGLLLIFLGSWLFAARFFPQLAIWRDYFMDWPTTVIGAGLLMFVLGLVFNAPGMAVPACIVGGIGGILMYQNNTGDWNSWAYAWALIPGFVGIGVLLNSVLDGSVRKEFPGAMWLIFISAVMFIVFGALLGGITVFGNYWPILLIVFGLWMMAAPLVRKRT